ncbi:MAG: hypothetical protein FWG98_12675 [Candidatus Cloacimonetes bacterium]|nr:hypothetical protein [Candidatus Cloacimonadota bacterium]
MLKKTLFVILIALVLFACKPKADNQEGAVVYTETRFFPVPEFADLFASLDYVQTANFDMVIPDTYLTDITNVYVGAFYLGNLTADAIVATKARNKTKLTSIAMTMIDYSRMIGINQEVLMMADEIMTLLHDDSWENLLLALDDYKKEIEFALYASRQIDLMTLVQAGGWTEGVYIMTTLLLQDFNMQYTAILNQKGIVDNLVNNLSQMENQALYELEWFQNLVVGFSRIHAIINVQGKELFTIEEVRELQAVTRSIKEGIGF